MRVIRLSLTLIFVFSGAMLAIHLIGGLFPNPIAVLFTNPDGSPCQMPCLLGVRTGVTTLDEALRLLDKHPLTAGLELKSDGQSVTLFTKEVLISLSPGDDGVIGSIYLHRSDNSSAATASELAWAMDHTLPGNEVLYFGKPDLILGSPIVFRQSGSPFSYAHVYSAKGFIFYNVGQQSIEDEENEPFLGLLIQLSSN